MSAEVDPLDALRVLYERLEPENPSNLAAQDRATRASVDWMQRAYRTVAPVDRRAAPVLKGARSISPWLKAAAAILFIGIGVLLIESRKARSLPEEPSREVAAGDAVEVAPAETAPPAQGESSPAIAFLGSDRVEMRSGPVRLILLTSPVESHSGELR